MSKIETIEDKKRNAGCFAGISMLADIAAEVMFWGWVFRGIGPHGKVPGSFRPLFYPILICMAVGLLFAILSERTIRKAPAAELVRKRDYLIPVLLVFSAMQPILIVFSFVVGAISDY